MNEKMDKTAAVKRYREMFASTKTASSKLADKIVARVEDKVEKILADLETTVKEHIPARYSKLAFATIAEKMKSEGINCRFDKTVTRKQLCKAAAVKCTKDDVVEACGEIVQSAVDEIEKVLEIASNTIEAAAGKHCRMKRTGKNLMNKMVADKLLAKGIRCKF